MIAPSSQCRCWRLCGISNPPRLSQLCSPVQMQIAEQGLTPDIAIRACNNPRITSSILSREIGKVVAERAEAEIARRRIKRKAEAASGLTSFARGGGATKDATGGEQQRPRRHSGGVARTVTPHPNEIHNAAASAGSILPPVRFTAPYLKGRPTHFERKLENHSLPVLTENKDH